MPLGGVLRRRKEKKKAKKKAKKKPSLAEEYRMPKEERKHPIEMAPGYYEYPETIAAPMHPFRPKGTSTKATPYERTPENFRQNWRQGAPRAVDAFASGITRLEDYVKNEKIKIHHWVRPIKTWKRWREKRATKKEIKRAKKTVRKLEADTRDILSTIEGAFEEYKQNLGIMDEFDARAKFFNNVAEKTNTYLDQFNQDVRDTASKREKKRWKDVDKVRKASEDSTQFG